MDIEVCNIGPLIKRELWSIWKSIRMSLFILKRMNIRNFELPKMKGAEHGKDYKDSDEKG